MNELAVTISLPLDRFELNVEFTTTAQVTGVFGPSGAGKTSLLRSIAGLKRNAKGAIRMGGETWLDSKAGIHRQPETRDIGYVPQDGLLFPHLSVRRNLLAGAARARRNGSPLDENFADVCDLLGLKPLLERDVATLSGGERQRVALGRAICSGPRLMLLDEPLASLDLPLRRKVLPFLRRVVDKFRIPTLLVTHDPIEVQALCEELIVLDEGRLVAQGPVRRVLTDPKIFPLAKELGFENVLPCILIDSDAETSRVRLSGSAASPCLITPRVRETPGVPLWVGIAAREIILAIQEPAGLSAQNLLAGTIANIQTVGGVRLVTVSLAAGIPEVAVEVTAHACDALRLEPGKRVFLIIKTQACVLYGASSADEARVLRS
jgi:molybdate transport system ATP-binding protein